MSIITKEKRKEYNDRYSRKFPWVRTFYDIKRRTSDEKFRHYARYGGRGIKCLITKEELKELWIRDKAHLLKWPSIDRINNDGNYEKSNCRYIEQNENKQPLTTECPKGHSKSDAYLWKRKDGTNRRECRECLRIRNKRRSE